MANGIPTQAEIVIIGGGIVGCSLAYHLAELGCRDVVLLEQGKLSCGTTWHAAGLVGQLRTHASLTRLIGYSAELYAALEAKTGLATGWKRCGSLTVARTPARMTALRRMASVARAQGVEIAVLDAREAGRKWPIMRTDDLAGAVWLPGDGKANPSDLTQALARGARLGGARMIEGVRVNGFRSAHGAVAGLETSDGTIAAARIAICAGQWSRALGELAGITIPLHSAEHMYAVTERIAGIFPDLPVLRDPDGYVYFKEEVGGLAFGGFEPHAKPWGMEGIPEPFEFQLLPDDWDQFEILMQNALMRVPALEKTPVKSFINGPESFTPDGAFILGAAPEMKGVFVACGFNSMGIAAAGGAGRVLAEWMLAGEPPCDLWPVDIRRFARFHGNRHWLRERVKESLGLHYAMPWPHRELESARPLRRSPLYERLAAKGAVFGSRMGWERPNWFSPGGREVTSACSFGRQSWFAAVAEEHRACRRHVALFDMTSLAKFFLQGRDAESVLQRLAANDVAIPAGCSVYTAMLNRKGGIESGLVVARLAPECFLLVADSAQATRDAEWIRRHIPEGALAVLTDMTSAFATLGIMGPAARELLGRLTHASLDNAAFPFGAIREIDIGTASTWAMRRSSVGEPGWELYVPTECAATVYDRLAATGADLGLKDAGTYAIESLRIEKGSRAWGRELGPDCTPFEAGLGFAVKLGKPSGFIGDEALLAARREPLTRRLVSFLATDPEAPLAWGGEMVAADGKPAGEITSAAFGHTLGAPTALGWVRSDGEPIDADWLARRKFTVDIAGDDIAFSARLSPFFDPGGKRMRS